jgi:hypothetical protein
MDLTAWDDGIIEWWMVSGYFVNAPRKDGIEVFRIEVDQEMLCSHERDFDSD